MLDSYENMMITYYRGDYMVLGVVIYGMCAMIMIIIGIVQYRSEEPVWFYTGETPPKKEELTDVGAWNKKHGRMWMIYGLIIILSAIIGCVMGDSIWCVIPMMSGVCVPLVFMILYHQHLVKKYRRGGGSHE